MSCRSSPLRIRKTLSKKYVYRTRDTTNLHLFILNTNINNNNYYPTPYNFAQKKPAPNRNGPCVDIFHCALANAVNYIFLPTFVFFATGAAFTAVALGALGALAFTTVASSTASVFFVDLRERRVLGLASSVETTLPNV